MKKQYLVQFTIEGKGPHFNGKVCHFTREVDAETLTAMVVDHKAGKLHIETVFYPLNEEQMITIYKERA